MMDGLSFEDVSIYYITWFDIHKIVISLLDEQGGNAEDSAQGGD